MPEDFSGLLKSMQTHNPVLDRLKDDLRKGALPNAEIEHPARKTNELLEEQNHKIDDLQTALDAANIQIATLHDTIKENEAAYQQEQREASASARLINGISIAIAAISLIVAILTAISPNISRYIENGRQPYEGTSESNATTPSK